MGLHHHHDAGQIRTQAAVLDIGGEVGALILYTGPELCGHEIEVSLKSSPDHRVHTAVLERKVNGRSVFAALYMSLEAGDYIIWKNETEPGGQVTIIGGEVVQLDWH
jgi:hypothetical protein